MTGGGYVDGGFVVASYFGIAYHGGHTQHFWVNGVLGIAQIYEMAERGKRFGTEQDDVTRTPRDIRGVLGYTCDWDTVFVYRYPCVCAWKC